MTPIVFPPPLPQSIARPNAAQKKPVKQFRDFHDVHNFIERVLNTASNGKTT